MTTTERTPPAHAPEHPDRGPSRARWWTTILVVLAVVGGSLAFYLIRNDDESTAPSTSDTTQPAATTPEVDRSTAVWPAAGGDQYTDPVVAAQAFAEDFLGFTAPVVGEFLAGDSRSGEVEVRPAATGPVTTVLVRQLSGEDTWSVLGAVTELIQVSDPETGATIPSPVPVSGTAQAFEGTVQVEVREDGNAAAIGSGFVTGGGDQMAPFEGQITFTAPSAYYGAIVFFTTSAEDGQVWSATTVRVAF